MDTKSAQTKREESPLSTVWPQYKSGATHRLCELLFLIRGAVTQEMSLFSISFSLGTEIGHYTGPVKKWAASESYPAWPVW